VSEQTPGDFSLPLKHHYLAEGKQVENPERARASLLRFERGIMASLDET